MSADPEQTSEDFREYVVTELDVIRRQEELVAASKAHYLQLAERFGVRVADIAEAIGMSESGVRGAIRRAKAGPPFLGGGANAGSLPEVR